MDSKVQSISPNLEKPHYQNFINQIASVGSELFFDILTKELAFTLKAKYCFISESIDKENNRARILSFWMDKQYGPNLEYCTIDTPCENATNEPITFFPQNVYKMFPDDEFVIELEVESYLAVPFFDINGQSIGHICIMNSMAMEKNIYHEMLMSIISVRVGAEVQRVRYERHLNHIATHDALTDLLNRSIVMDRIEHAIELASRNNDLVGILYIDLDKFKLINDKYGHEAGDYYLMSAANCIKTTIRKCDSACRMGGDEFLIIVENIKDIESIEKIVKNLYINLKNKICELEGDNISISSSIGFSIYPIHSSESKKLVSMADSAMYSAKNNQLGFTQFQK